MAHVKAKKYLGQHFLRDTDVARRIVESLPLDDASCVLEIGPGMGVLTRFLIQIPNIRLKAIEIDTESVNYLRFHYPQLDLLEGDFLKISPDKIFPEKRDVKYTIIGNFPYNISSQIFFNVLDNRDSIPHVVCMIQKEVAERMAAKSGSKTYGILSVLMQAFYSIDYLFTVHEHVFDPPPKVKSAVIRLTRNDIEHIQCDEQLFKTVVKTAFNQRRKTMRNSLKPLVPKESPMYNNPLFDKRPEQLDVQTFVELTNMVATALQSIKKQINVQPYEKK
ncbi:MAG: 16S rRNA (adenine(1518)-N(6)/adenine(1519)-N(6))-dimethyltransferase RsmA [Prevotellaceae bacterium]|jgi:16S rRNA (adenine1518-N6/adenine1519-N6)-dimethyltransferase|nr:16S rRNA (adenine(1518)-N(6)/adenine(1519)-N(6))-dimethyltransferase RsmA [Prevotellaceae bacterium]